MSDPDDFLAESLQDDERERSYEERACDEITALIEREHAVVWHEVEARLAEQAPRADRLNPHHLSNARRQLIANNVIAEYSGVTKGGRELPVLGLYDLRKRRTAFDRAARRKRLLETRYLGWAGGTVGGVNPIGSAGELVTHASLVGARERGAPYQLLSEERSDLRRLFGNPIPGGPIDDAAHLIVDTAGIPTLVTIMIEVKNVRPWLYPNAAEIYQLLHKAAQVQHSQPNQHIMPVLVARQVHYLTRRMAKHLGFFTITFEGGMQPLRNMEFVEPHFVDEVNEELGYNLILTNGEALPFIERAFQFTIPQNALETAKRWAMIGPALEHHFGRLRNSSIRTSDREAALDSLYRDVCHIVRPTGPWRKARRGHF